MKVFWATALITISSLFFGINYATASSEPTFPPRQECVDRMAAEQPLIWSRYYWHEQKVFNAFQRVVDAGCLRANPLGPWTWEYMDYDRCLEWERISVNYFRQISAWADPYWQKMKTINNAARQRIVPLKRQIYAAKQRGDKKKLKKLKSRERRVVGAVRRQFQDLARPVAPLALKNNLPYADILINDIYVHGCEFYQPFFERQKHLYTSLSLAHLHWIKTYIGQVSERNWADWIARWRYVFFPQLVDVRLSR